MTLFVVSSCALVLLALALVIPPLLRPPRAPVFGVNQRLAVLADGLRELDAELAGNTLGRDEYEEAKRELERQALEADAVAAGRRAPSAGRAGWSAALAIGIALPVAAVVLYVALGQPAALSGAAQTGIEGQNPQVVAMIERLSRRLKEHPGDAEGWLLLARSYGAVGRTQDSVAAYRKLAALQPGNADLLIEFANALAVENGRNLAGEPEQLIERALKIDPDNLNALALAGAAALQAGRRNDAVRDWTRLEHLIPVDSADRPRVQALIARAQGKRIPAAAGTAIGGTVTVSAALAGKVAPTDTLFVFARAAGGPPMPLAVVRTPAADWPAAFTLDDSRAMTPELHLSQFPRVSIVARISRTGSATARPGDLEGRLDGVALGSRGVRVVIDHVIDH